MNAKGWWPRNARGWLRVLAGAVIGTAIGLACALLIAGVLGWLPTRWYEPLPAAAATAVPTLQATVNIPETGYEIEIVRLSGEWAWNAAMDTANPGIERLQHGCNDPNSTMLLNEYAQNCYTAINEVYLRGWQINLSMRTNVGVVLACLRLHRAAGGNELIGCANCGSSGGGCTSSVGMNFGDGYRTLRAGDEIGFRIDGYGTPCTGVASVAWTPSFFCESPVEIQANLLLEATGGD